MLRVLDYYIKDLRYDIYQRLARIQQQLNNLGEAELYWAEAEKYANSPEQNIQTLLGWHNTVHPRDAQRSLRVILPRAHDLAKKNAPHLLPDVLYEFGFTHDRLQIKEEAIRYYREALQKYNELELVNPERKATILNDLGFALARQGEYEEGSELVGQGRDIRQSLYDEALQELAFKSGALSSERDELIRLALEKEQNKARGGVRRATLRLGWAHSAEAQISRYSNQMPNALRHYEEALKLFNQSGNDYWVALTQNRRGETLRRMAREQHEKRNFKRRDELFREAHQAIDESIYLAEKYGLQSQSLEIFERRKGRLFHDEAIWAIEKGQKAKALKLLEQARGQFVTAIQTAERLGNAVEALESEVELMFLQDDFVEVQGAEHNPEAVREELEQFRQILRTARRRGERIFQVDVYEYLWEIENGAYWHEVAQTSGSKKDYERALEHYVKGYVGVARLPGYGQYRFRKHLDHLKRHIEDIQNSRRAISWCNRFLDEFSRRTVKGSKNTTLAEGQPEFIVWLNEHIVFRGGKL
jgi:tetratricopeptide (TPR) repeat protein